MIYRGQEIKIERDEYAESPDNWGDDEIFLVFTHRQFNVKVEGFNPEYIYNYFKLLNRKPNLSNSAVESYDERFGLWEDEIDVFSQYNFSDYKIFPVSAYIHSGVSLSLGEQSGWDTSSLGFILVKNNINDLDDHEEMAQGLIDTWNDYLSGNIWQYSTDSDSCSGFYGNEGKKQMIEEVKHQIDFAIAIENRRQMLFRKKQIKNKVPLIYRNILTIN